MGLRKAFQGCQQSRQPPTGFIGREAVSREACVLETQAFLGDTSAKVQSTTVSVQSPVCCFSLVHLGLAGTGLQESTGQCQLLPVARATVPHTTALEHPSSAVKQEVLLLAHLSPTLAYTRGQPQVPWSSRHSPACS